MTDSIYDIELYSTSFLFTYEEYLSVKSHAELPLKCSSQEQGGDSYFPDGACFPDWDICGGTD